MKTLSIVLPCYNEELVIENTYRILKNLVDKWIKTRLIYDYELVMVNDGSTDLTIDKMLLLKSVDSKITIVDFRANFGFQSCISAGLFNASGDMIVSIDADLQDDPEKIEEMIQKHYLGFDMVLGVRSNRDSDSFFKRKTAELFYKIMNLLGTKTVYNHADFRLLSKELVDELKKFNEANRFLRALIFKVENKYDVVYYKRTERLAGNSKFNLSAMISLAINGITSFSVTPIRLIFGFGFITFVVSILFLIYLLVLKYLLNETVQGWTSIMFLIILFGSFQSIMIGVVGEYISKTYIESKNRPLYLIRKIYR